jgi:hypothetical protein
MDDDTQDMIDTIDVSLDNETLETDPAGLGDDGLDTVQETALDSLELDPVTLATIHHSVRWGHLQQSKSAR